MAPLLRGCPPPNLWEKLDRSALPDFLRDHVPPQAPRDPGDDMYLEPASCDGHGTLEMLEVSRVLEENGVLCAFCGVSALIYYGAGRVRSDWDICVPSDLVEKAAAIFKSEERSNDYFAVAAQPIPLPGSLRHTYHRFRVRNLFLHFNVVPVDDIHLELAPVKIQRSRYGLPYPKLHVLIQSFLDTKDMVSLADVVDVTDEWGQEHLNLEGETDVEWAAWKNKRIVACTSTILGGGVPSMPFKKRDLWRDVVSTKLGRCGWKRPHTHFKTRFRLIRSIDPWLEPNRICS